MDGTVARFMEREMIYGAIVENESHTDQRTFKLLYVPLVYATMRLDNGLITRNTSFWDVASNVEEERRVVNARVSGTW